MVDCVVALNGAMFINGAILILAAATFYRIHKDVTEIQQAYVLLTPTPAAVPSGRAALVGAKASGPEAPWYSQLWSSVKVADHPAPSPTPSP